jgi:hypothetical protein
LHSCRVGRSYFDESGNYVPTYAEKMSKEFPNLIIIAPDERDVFTDSGERGPRHLAMPFANNRGDPTPDDPSHITNSTKGS